MPYRRRPALKKRGFTFKARAGNWVPFVGGSSIELQKRGLKALVRRQALKTEETKKVTTGLTGGSNWVHNTMYSVKLNNIPQGTDIGSRQGDRVYYCGFNIKMQYAANSAVPNQYVRIYVIRTRDTTVGASASAWGSTIGSSLMFRNNDTAPTAFVNSDQVTLLASKTCKLDAQYSGDVQVRECRINVKLMKPFQFRTGTQEGEHYNYYLIVLPYATSGTPVTGTTVVGSTVTNIQQIFKDA